MDVTQSYVDERLKLLPDLRNVLEQGKRILHGHLEQVCNGCTFVLHRQRLAIVAPPAAHFAGDENVGQEVHFNAPQTVAAAGLATPAFHVETEAPGPVSSFPRSNPATYSGLFT